MHIPDHWVEEEPFDVAEWGGRVVKLPWETEAEMDASIQAKPTPEFEALVARQQELERERLG